MYTENIGTSLALGTFDGLHLGHKAVIEAAKNAVGVPAVLMFNEHPQRLLSGNAPGELITKQKEKELLFKWGVKPEYIDFGAICDLSAEEFFCDILISRLRVKSLSCGFNYRFGKNAAGNAGLLKELCEKHGVSIAVLEPVMFDNRPISSTRIRNALKYGEIDNANKMLGRNFSYDFTVVHGDARGRTIGSPTINQFFPEGFTVPEFGVYASYTVVGGKLYPSVTNIGIRPTIGNSPERSETNILGVNEDLYGKNIEVGLIKKLRGEMKFSSIDELSVQIAKDRESAVKIFDSEGVIL